MIMTEAPSIHNSLLGVMRSVGAVRKSERNNHGGYSFRGIDTVRNAVQPALLEHRVTFQPNVREAHHGEVTTGKNRTPMGHAWVIVEATWTGPAGDAILSSATAEAFDSGDKAMMKAQSVAIREILLSTLMLPTDEAEPDAQSYERSQPATRAPEPPPTPQDELTLAKSRAWTLTAQRGDQDARLVYLEEQLNGIGSSIERATAEDYHRLIAAWEGK